MNLNVVRTGPRGGVPVVLVHSAGLDLTHWDHQIEALRADHDVVALDLPGHGRSRARPEDMQVPLITSQVASVIADLDAGPADVVGLSVGGLVAQTLGRHHPALVSSLVLLDTGARFAADAQAAMRERATILRRDGWPPVLDGLFGHWLRPDTVAQRPDLVDRATKTLLAHDAVVHAALWEMIADFDGVSDLPAIAVPTTVFVGEHDSSSPLATATALADGIAGAHLQVIPDAAHLSPLDQPADVSHRLRELFAADRPEVHR